MACQADGFSGASIRTHRLQCQRGNHRQDVCFSLDDHGSPKILSRLLQQVGCAWAEPLQPNNPPHQIKHSFPVDRLLYLTGHWLRCRGEWNVGLQRLCYHAARSGRSSGRFTSIKTAAASSRTSWRHPHCGIAGDRTARLDCRVVYPRAACDQIYCLRPAAQWRRTTGYSERCNLPW